MSEYIIELEGASIYQQETVLIFNDVNLKLANGEFAYLIGKTGSGKTSLLKTIYAALKLGRGEGQVAGFDLNQVDRKTIPLLRRKLGIVFQDFNLLTDRSVKDNLSFVLRATAWKEEARMNVRINEVLKMVGLQNKLDSMPHQLSGGEQQRIVIARALLNNPILILADEPTGNLDPETSEEIVSLLRDISMTQDTAILFATHDYRIMEKFPARIIRAHSGRIIDEENFVI